MAKSYDFNKYDSWYYDDDFCLKPPVLLTAAMVYLCRSFLIMMLILAATTRGRTSGGMEAFLPGGEHPMSIGLTAIPAMLVLYARVRRSHKAGDFVRRIWKRGRLLLGLSAALEIATGAFLLYSSVGEARDADLLRVAFLMLDVYILLYMVFSKHVRDVFSDFPPP